MSVLAILLGGATVNAAPPTGTPWPADAVELFLDDHLVESMPGLSRRVIRPTKHESNPRLVTNLPWEQRLVTYNATLFDPATGTHRMWYLTSYGPDGIPAGTYPGTGEYPVAYAESVDAGVPIEWDRPMVGEAYGEFAETNIVVPDSHGWTVVVDEESPPAERYKAVSGGVWHAVSPDGYDWTVWGDELLLKDTSPALYRWQGRWHVLGRTTRPDPDTQAMRRVTHAAAETFRGPWTPEEVVVSLDALPDEAPWVQPYQVAVEPWGNQLVGVLRHIRLDEEPGNLTRGLTTSELITSRDGITWTRLRQPFLWPTEGEWDRGGVVPGARFYRHDNRVVFVYAGTAYPHGDSRQKYDFGIATLPDDRFACIEGDGTLTTKALEPAGTNLVVNADGPITVEVLNAAGGTLVGFASGDMLATELDDLRRVAAWAGGSLADAVAAAGGVVRLRFHVPRTACLYAMAAASA